MKKKLIIDTDIGSDVDDAIALVFALKSGEIDVKALTTVHGDTKLRARIAKRLAEYVGEEIDVAYGESMPIRQKHVYWFGHEGKYILRKNRQENVRPDGVDLLVRKIIENEGIEIAALGPLTNIAKALQKEPCIAGEIGHLYMMGNAIIETGQYHINYRAHNFKVDPEAVDIVMEADIPKTIITTDVAKKVEITRADLEMMKIAGKPELAYIARSAFQHMKSVGYEVCYPYDPMVIGNIIMSELFDRKTYRGVSIVTEVNASAFKKRLLEGLR